MWWERARSQDRWLSRCWGRRLALSRGTEETSHPDGLEPDCEGKSTCAVPAVCRLRYHLSHMCPLVSFSQASYRMSSTVIIPLSRRGKLSTGVKWCGQSLMVDRRQCSVSFWPMGKEGLFSKTKTKQQQASKSINLMQRTELDYDKVKNFWLIKYCRQN